MEESIYTAKTMEISTLNADPYKKLPNEVGGREITLPEKVVEETQQLLSDTIPVPAKRWRIS